MLTISRGPSPPFDDHSEKEVRQLVGVADAVQLLEDILSQKQYLKAVQLLHTIRKHWREDVFGSGEEDDVHCLFFIYARYITDQQEGEQAGLCDATVYCIYVSVKGYSKYGLAPRTFSTLCTTMSISKLPAIFSYV